MKQQFKICYNKQKILKVPQPETTSSGHMFPYPYVFVRDDAFQLTDLFTKSYPRAVLSLKERIFNYRISRARRIIENTFGIAAALFRIFRRPIIAGVESVVRVTKAIIVLHNFLKYNSSFNDNYSPSGFINTDNRPGDWRSEAASDVALRNISNFGSNNYTRDAKVIILFQEKVLFPGSRIQ